MSPWSLSSSDFQTSRKSHKVQAEKKKQLLISLMVPLALALMTIPLFLIIIMKLIEWML